MSVPIAITAGIVANIATAILQNYLQNLHNTLIGRILKRAGLVEIDFHDRIVKTLRKSLKVFFAKHPEYSCQPILSFFQDPCVAQQLGAYILDRRPLNAGELQITLKHYLTRDSLISIWAEQKNLDSSRIISSFLKCYRVCLIEQSDFPHFALLLEILDQGNSTIDEMASVLKLEKTLIMTGIKIWLF